MQRIIDMASMYDERRVICALNEAVCNEVCDLNYIERILQNWQQKGLSTEDLENGKRRMRMKFWMKWRRFFPMRSVNCIMNPHFN